MPSLGDELFVYGFPANQDIDAQSLLLKARGPDEIWDRDRGIKIGRLIGVKDDSVIGGFSGAPMLCTRTWKVCGIVKWTRGVRNAGGGGGGVPIAQAFVGFPSLGGEVRLMGINAFGHPNAEDAIEICPSPVYVEIEKLTQDSDWGEFWELLWGRPHDRRPLNNNIEEVLIAAELDPEIAAEIRELKSIFHSPSSTFIGDIPKYGLHEIRLSGALTLRNWSERTIGLRFPTHTEAVSDLLLIERLRQLALPEIPFTSSPENLSISIGPKGKETEAFRVAPNDEVETLIEIVLRWNGQFVSDNNSALEPEQARVLSELVASHALLSVHPGSDLRVEMRLIVSSRPTTRYVHLAVGSLARHVTISYDGGRYKIKQLSDPMKFMQRWLRVWKAGIDERSRQFTRRINDLESGIHP